MLVNGALCFLLLAGKVPVCRLLSLLATCHRHWRSESCAQLVCIGLHTSCISDTMRTAAPAVALHAAQSAGAATAETPLAVLASCRANGPAGLCTIIRCGSSPCFTGYVLALHTLAPLRSHIVTCRRGLRALRPLLGSSVSNADDTAAATSAASAIATARRCAVSAATLAACAVAFAAATRRSAAKCAAWSASTAAVCVCSCCRSCTPAA